MAAEAKHVGVPRGEGCVTLCDSDGGGEPRTEPDTEFHVRTRSGIDWEADPAAESDDKYSRGAARRGGGEARPRTNC